MTPRDGRWLDAELAPFNFAFWAAMVPPWTLIAVMHARKVYPELGRAFWLASCSTELRALSAMGAAVLLGNMLKRPLGRLGELIPAAAFLGLTTFQSVSACVFAFVGLPLSAMLRYLGSGDPARLWWVLLNIGMPAGFVSAVLAGAGLVLVLGAVLLIWTQGLAARRNWKLPTALVVEFCYAAIALIVVEQVLSGRVKDPDAWRREQSTAPLYAAALSPRGLARYPALFRVPDLDAPRAAAGAAPRNATVVLVILESFRADLIDAATTPNLDRFRSENASFPDAVANGNSTDLAWPAIYASAYPALAQPPLAASPAVRILRRAGFRVSAFAARESDSILRTAIAGPGEKPAEVRFADGGFYSPENDRLSTRRLLDALDAERGAGRNFHILSLDASHAPYRWPADFEARFLPFSPLDATEGGSLLRDVREGARLLLSKGGGEALARFHNRYMNSARFEDALFGELVARLKALGLYDKAVVVVVGDHGQEFMEHGGVAHGSNLFGPQIRVPLIMKLPGRRPPSTAGPASQVDIMPTVLDYLGLGREAQGALGGHSLLRAATAPRAALTRNAGALDPRIQEWTLTTSRYKIGFALTAGFGAVPLVVWRVSDRDDKPVIPGRGTAADYREFLDREFVPPLNEAGAIAVPAGARP